MNVSAKFLRPDRRQAELPRQVLAVAFEKMPRPLVRLIDQRVVHLDRPRFAVIISHGGDVRIVLPNRGRAGANVGLIAAGILSVQLPDGGRHGHDVAGALERAEDEPGRRGFSLRARRLVARWGPWGVDVETGG